MFDLDSLHRRLGLHSHFTGEEDLAFSQPEEGNYFSLDGHHSSYSIVKYLSSSDIYHSILLNISCVFNNSPRVDLAYYD